jgi:type I restriction enzyme S subunit
MKEGWEIKKLGEVAVVSSGNSAPQKKELFENGIYPFIRTSDVGQIRKGFISSCVDYLNKDGIKGLKLYTKGTILFPKSGASTFLNHRVMLEIDSFVSSHLATIKGNNSITDDRFLLYFLTTIDARNLMQDIAYPSLKTSDISLISIPLPPLPEQQRIVSIIDKAFEAIDKAIENTQKNLQNAKELFESYLNSVFEDCVNEWVTSSLEYVVDEDCKLSYGIVQPGEDFENGLPVVRPTDLINKTVNLSTLKRIDPRLSEGYKRTKLVGDEILICVRGNTGIISMVTTELQNANVTRGIVPIRFNSKLINQEFGYYMLKSGYVQKQIKTKTYGAALMQINIGDLRKIKTVFSNLDEQLTMVKKLDSLCVNSERLQSKYQQKLRDLEELKKSVLNKAFAGEL